MTGRHPGRKGAGREDRTQDNCACEDEREKGGGYRCIKVKYVYFARSPVRKIDDIPTTTVNNIICELREHLCIFINGIVIIDLILIPTLFNTNETTCMSTIPFVWVRWN